MALNRVMLIGNIGQGPDVNTTPGGVKVAKFTVATTERWKDKNTGTPKEQTEWHTVRCWRYNAEFVEKYAKKGARVFVEGKLHTEVWEKDGQKNSRLLIEAEDIQLLDGKPDNKEVKDRQRREEKPAADDDDSLEPKEDDLPF